MKRTEEKFMTAALVFHIFLSFSGFIKYLHNLERYSSGNNELNFYVRCSNLRYIPYKALR